MLSIFKIFGHIAIDNSAADKALDETTANAREAGAKISTAFESIGNKAIAIGKTIAAGLAVGTAAIGALTVSAMNKAGELEQNMGGSEAVFKEHAQGMQETAKTAYKNMGLSASGFLATTNKMGALFQGVGFDIEESATISAEAMQRAADVASIMGVDIEWAMESIAGAAKGNFTMLDNLGVAVNDTTLNMYALEKGIDKTTQEMTTQEKVALAMELFMERTAYATGNYAKENDTLAGSLSTAKAALDNFLSGAGDATALADAFTDSAEVILLKLDTLLPSLVTGIGQLVKKLGPKLPGLLARLVPNAVEAMSGIVTALLPQLPQMIAELAPVLIQGAKDLGRAMIEAIGETIPALEEVFEDLGVRISDLLIMVGGLVLAFKGFSIVQTVISAISTLKTAFLGLNAVLAANPIGLVVSALGLLVVAIGALRDASYVAVEPAYELSEAEKSIRDRAEEAAEAQRKLQESFIQEAGAIEAETQRTKDLWVELQTLADAEGNVEEANRNRAAFILQELSEATGQEWEMVDGTILKYQELAGSIENTIDLKRAEALLAAREDDYTQAVQERANAIEDLKDKQTAYRAEADRLAETEARIAEIQGILLQGYSEAEALSLGFDLHELDQELDYLNRQVGQMQENVATTEAAYREAEESVKGYHETIWEYETASAEMLAGNFEEATRLLTEDIAHRWQRVEDIKALSAEELDQLKNDMSQAASYAEWYKEQFESGMEGFTEKGLKEASQAASDLMGIWQDAAYEAEQAGKAIGDGISSGIEEQAKKIYSTARLVMSRTMGTMKEVAQIASPSKVTTEFGRFLVEGLSEGITESQHMAETAASDAMYRTTDSFAQGLTASHAPGGAESYREEIQELLREFSAFIRDLPDMMAEAFASMSLKINNREFGRMVRAVE